MQEIVLGNRKLNRGEQLAVAIGGAALVLYVTRFDISTLWLVGVGVYLTIVLLLLLRGQRFVILNEEGIDYKSSVFGQSKWYAWANVVKVIANSTGVTLHLKDGSTAEFLVEKSQWFNFRKFRTSVERFARLHNIHIFIQVVEMAGDSPDLKRLSE
ncbi:MAG: hypothetical protein ACOVSW_15165 [Candidatus Kapaibacteriota bacterium]|jgi:hypothetical protein